jgi:cell division control protein 45
MILEHEQWYFGYDQILKDCRPSGDDGDFDGGSKTALILCNADVDAMSSARILSYMLRSDGIHYQLLPCSSYGDLKERLSYMASQGATDDIRALVLLNFGAAFNLTSLYESELLLPQTKTYVMDCRRPIHLANVYAPSSVVVFLDSTQDQKDMPSDGDNLSGDDSSSSESSDSDGSDSENDSDSDHGDSASDDDDDDEEEASFDDVVGQGDNSSNARKSATAETDPSYDAEDEDDGREAGGTEDQDNDPPPKRQRTDNNNRNINDNINENENDNNVAANGATDETEDASPGAGADLSQQPSVAPRELHRQRRDRLRKYYTEGSFYGSPASFVAYRLASQHRYGEQGDLLWLACVGVTDAYLHARLDLIGYARLAGELTETCRKLYPSGVFDRALTTVYAEDLVGGGSHRGARGTGGNATSQTKIALSENGRIFSEKDFRFFMLRHSSLLDSMQYSDYVCTKLQLYTKKGEQRLLEMLARMGYPLDECKQPFAFMRPSLRRRLKDKLGTHAKVSCPPQTQSQINGSVSVPFVHCHHSCHFFFPPTRPCVLAFHSAVPRNSISTGSNLPALPV